MSWYDEQFGHMPWQYEEEGDDSEIATQVEIQRWAYGIPRWYGHVQGRSHPDYWMI